MVLRLQFSSGVVVSHQTVRNRLHEYGLPVRRKTRCPPIRYGNRARRNKWYREHFAWTKEQWCIILFCDESWFGFRLGTKRIRVYRHPRYAERLRCVQKVHPYSGLKVMVWAGIMTSSRTELVFIYGNMNAKKYVGDVRWPFVHPFTQSPGPDFTLMHDNAHSHSARRTRNYLAMENLRVLPWPAQSQDLNTMKHTWNKLQRRVLENLNGESNTQQLKDLLKLHSERLPQDFINNLINSIKNRCRRVLNIKSVNNLY